MTDGGFNPNGMRTPYVTWRAAKSLQKGAIVRFKNLKNWRGYQLCGNIIEADDEYARVEAIGYEGAGTKTEINNVPLADLEECDPR